MKTFYIANIETVTYLFNKKELKEATRDTNYMAVCLGKLNGETYAEKKQDLIDKEAHH